LRTLFQKSVSAVFAILFLGTTGVTSYYPAQSSDAKLFDTNIIRYIHGAWHTLRRSMDDCSSLLDPKLGRVDQTLDQPLVFVPQNMVPQNMVPQNMLPRNVAPPPSLQGLATGCKLRIEALPQKITRLGMLSPDALPAPGLLYLPHPYVVPGGRFNEMYGWDSYFIIRGLIEDGEVDLARGMVENFFFEIENYGGVLNANRTYYLTRSQPPFLTSMIMAVHGADKTAGRDDRAWLARAYAYAERDYSQWIRVPKRAGSTGLSRYFDMGSGPVPEVADHPEYYATVADWLVRHPQIRTGYLAVDGTPGIGPELRVPRCGTGPCDPSHTVQFTPDYYKGDRAMRESGFDISFRFGPFGGSAHHFAPVCLNSLLYKTEKDMEEIAGLLHRPREAALWHERANRRKKLVNRFLWNPRLNLFTDFDFRRHQASSYRYATTFYPLWTGLATKAQAKAVMKNLKTFEQPGGIVMSDRQTGVQWDMPHAWAPIQMLAVEGMRRYGFTSEADRVTKEFLTMVARNFLRDGTIREKYDAVRRSTEIDVTAGYTTNVVGFGWTNATFMVLLHQLPAAEQESVLAGSL